MARRVWAYWLLSVLLTTCVGWLAHDSDTSHAQRQLGRELALQLASSSAPWLLNEDMTSLNLMLAGLDGRPGLAQVEIVDRNGRQLAATTLNGLPGQRIVRPIRIGQQHLGELTLTLHASQPLRWLRDHTGPLSLMAALQLLCFVLAGRKPRQPANRPQAPVAPMQTLAGSQPSPFRPAPPPCPQEALLCVLPDDSRQLLSRLSQHLLTDVFEVMNQLLERVARLSGGSLVRPMSGPEGALLRFDGCERTERAHQALSAAVLSLQLAERAGQVRGEEELLWLPMKAGLHCRPAGQDEDFDIAGLLALAAPAQQLLVSGAPALPEAIKRRQYWGRPVLLDIAEAGELQATPLERLDAQAEAAVQAQAARLVPLTAADNQPAALV